MFKEQILLNIAYRTWRAQFAPSARTFLKQQGKFVQCTHICTSLIHIDEIFINITIYML